MPNKKLHGFSTVAIVIIVVVGALLLVSYFIFSRYVIPQAVDKVVEKTITITTDNLKVIDYSKATTEQINQQLQNTQPTDININQAQGNISIDRNGTSVIQGQTKYLGQKPNINFEENSQNNIFTYKSVGENADNLILNLPSNPTNLKIGSGASIINLNLQQINVPNLDIGVGAGQVNITFSNKYSTHANLASGAGQLNLKIPKNVGIRISEAQGASLNVNFGNAYQKVNGGYQTKNYAESQVKIDLTIGQAVGGFNMDIIE